MRPAAGGALAEHVAPPAFAATDQRHAERVTNGAADSASGDAWSRSASSPIMLSGGLFRAMPRRSLRRGT
ncbi:hypothetical protein AQ475_22460 [Burkholderia thailandensis]|nr:hypothetical protein AQ475_22460 [Burkholderia thailandensis]